MRVRGAVALVSGFLVGAVLVKLSHSWLPGVLLALVVGVVYLHLSRARDR